MARTVKVAVIGSGLAGLTAAYLLAQSSDTEVDFEVHVFDKSSSLGMDSSSISLPIPDTKKEWRIDVPMRSFQGGYYPQLIAMYRRLGVTFCTRDFSYSFSVLPRNSTQRSRPMFTTVLYNGSSGRAGVSMPSTLITENKRVDPIGWLMILMFFAVFVCQITLNYLRLLCLSLPFWRPKDIENMTFAQWAEYTVPKGYLARLTGWDASWRDFTQSILAPLFSAVCTTSEEDVMEHPVEEMLDYIWLTLGTHHYVVVNGSREVVSRLTSNVRHIHLSSCITRIQPDSGDSRLVSITCNTPEDTTVHTGFHHVIFATQAPRAVPLLQSYLASLPAEAIQRNAIAAQIESLSAFRYTSTIVINHTDDSLIPDRPGDRRDLNLVTVDRSGCGNAEGSVKSSSCFKGVPLTGLVSETHTMATQVLPVPTGYAKELPQVYQTTNPIIAPREGTVVSVAVLERAVLTLEAKRSLQGLHEETGRRWWQCRVESSTKLGRLQGAGRMNGAGGVPGVWICGSFAYGGIPLLEGCVVSARTVVEQGLLASEGVAVKNSPW